MKPDILTLKSVLLSQFSTISIPENRYADFWPSSAEPPDMTRPRFSDGMEVAEYQRARYRSVLMDHCHHAVFDRIEYDSDYTGIRLHLFLLAAEAAELVTKLAGELCGPGNPARFNPDDFVKAYVFRLSKCGRLETRHPWWEPITNEMMI
jgi:hypothetical protein